MTKTASEPCSLALRKSVSPSMRGIRTSERTTSGATSEITRSASMPSAASLIS